MERVIIVGAGVMGLTCAVRLLECGHEVHVLARDLPLETTSAVAAALWYPYRASPADRVRHWGRRAFDAFAALAADGDDTGVRMRSGVELLAREEDDPAWAVDVRSYSHSQDAPAPYVGARTFTAPVADMSVYLPWLHRRVEHLGGTVTRLAVSSMPRPRHGVVVDTSGLGARHLARDASVQPLRGQVVVVEQFGLTEWSLDGAVPTYVVPRERSVIVGGTAEAGGWSVQPDAELAPVLLDRAHDLLLRTGDPAMAERLRRARVMGHRVGLRPERPSVRVEEEMVAGVRVVHCYGHGGAGMTLSWGCADEVSDLLRG